MLTAAAWFVADSALEERRFEPLVPPVPLVTESARRPESRSLDRSVIPAFRKGVGRSLGPPEIAIQRHLAVVGPRLPLSSESSLPWTPGEGQNRALACEISTGLGGRGRKATMQTRNRGDYTIANRELVAEGADLRVQVLSLAAGQCVPWHYHSEISDSFVCLEGPMVVETRAPRRVYRLLPGERCAVPPKTAHYVRGEADGPCKFLIVQGIGVYDFVPVGG
jgi:quercetin dioxygenase-like cupin family protein